MRSRIVVAVAAAVTAAALGLTACGSSGDSDDSSGSGPAPSAASGKPITVGVLTSLTGSGASGYLTVEKGVKARFAEVNAKGGVNGHQLKYVMADDASTAAGAASAARKLVQQDKVYAVLPLTSFFSGAAPVLKASGIPIVGTGTGGEPQWQDKSFTNLFDAAGNIDFTKVPTTLGEYFKSRGATKIASIGYGVSPASANAAQAAVISAEHAGLKKAYLNAQLAFGTTDVGPLVLAIKSSGADALYLPVVPDTAFAIAAALQQSGVKMKSVLLSTGYGGDLLKSKPTVAAAEGMDFLTVQTPVEADTDATKAMQDALATYADETGQPTFAEYIGWSSADLFVTGLKDAGDNASAEQFITKLRASTWDGAGLQKPIDYADQAPIGAAMGPGNCVNVVKMTSGKFVPVDGATPICGEIINGVTVGS